jgi:Zn-dependent protease with chaperone function
MKALNQLTLGDEARAGFILVSAFCCFDVLDGTTQFFKWIATSLNWIPNSPQRGQSIAVVGGMQLATLLCVCAAITFVRFRHLLWRFDCTPLAELAPAFSIDADQLSHAVAGRHIQIMLTSGMSDSNAFCVNSARGATVIAGGGLWLQYNKRHSRDLALAKLAHEFAHIRNRDTTTMLVATNLVIAYCILEIAGLLYSQVWFWSNVQWQGFYQAGWGFWQTFATQFHGSLFALVPVPSLIAVVTAHLLLVKNREFFADEVAAIHGYRSGIKTELGRAIDVQGAVGSVFHPTATARKRHVSDPYSWTRVNLLFVACIIFITARFSDSFSGVLAPFSTSSQENNNTLFDAIVSIRGNMVFILESLGEITIYILGIGIVVHHVYRTALSKLALGRRITSIIVPAALAGLACIAGDWLGTILAPRFLTIMMSTLSQRNEYMESQLLGSMLAGSVAAIFALASAALAVIAAITAPYHRYRLLGWMAALCPIAFLTMIPFNFLTYLTSVGAGMPDIFTRPVAAGLPPWVIPAQSTAIFCTILIFGGLCNVASVRIRRRAPAKIHPERIIEFGEDHVTG